MAFLYKVYLSRNSYIITEFRIGEGGLWIKYISCHWKENLSCTIVKMNSALWETGQDLPLFSSLSQPESNTSSFISSSVLSPVLSCLIFPSVLEPCCSGCCPWCSSGVWSAAWQHLGLRCVWLMLRCCFNTVSVAACAASCHMEGIMLFSSSPPLMI